MIGPKYDKFEEAKRMIQLGGMKAVHRSEDIQDRMNELTAPSLRRQLGNINERYIKDNKGSTEKIYAQLRSLDFWSE